jgi:hypothetical protein
MAVSFQSKPFPRDIVPETNPQPSVSAEDFDDQSSAPELSLYDFV